MWKRISFVRARSGMHSLPRLSLKTGSPTHPARTQRSACCASGDSGTPRQCQREIPKRILLGHWLETSATDPCSRVEMDDPTLTASRRSCVPCSRLRLCAQSCLHQVQTRRQPSRPVHSLCAQTTHAGPNKVLEYCANRRTQRSSGIEEEMRSHERKELRIGSSCIKRAIET